VTTVPGTTYTTPVIITDAPANVSPTAGVVAANNAVGEKIRSLLVEDAYLNSAARDVRFSVYDGRVTMTGRTGTATQRERMQAAIAALPGVYQVEDRVELNLGR
jgi:osmotically-inducible protein OsmY